MSGPTRARRTAAIAAGAPLCPGVPATTGVHLGGQRRPRPVATAARHGGHIRRLRTATFPVVSGSGALHSCQGESGGPLFTGGVLAGITSRGEGYAETGPRVTAPG
ncbi:trypsin-like serine protease [Streptomyces sp. XM83C]|uniref:trypsin-like serine protease n=1 Tax=Streptomyces sp. XM83C TaxID=2929781 RepID=UPI0035A8488D